MSGNSSEMIAQVNPLTGEIIGRVDRNQAHADGTWHASIHVWVVDRNNDVLFQQRNAESHFMPSLWDISAAGHIDEGEDGLREVQEELGVTPPANELTKHGYLELQHNIPPIHNREWARLYLWKTNLSLSDFTFPDGEVQALAAVPLEDFEDFINGETLALSVLRNGKITTELISGEKVVPQIDSYWAGVRKMLALG